MTVERVCPDCDSFSDDSVTRRRFVQTVGATAVAASAAPGVLAGEVKKQAKSETLVKKLFTTFTPKQREHIHFGWDEKRKGVPLRLHVAANWFITDKKVGGDFYTAEQKDLIEAIFWGLYNPDWHDRIKRQLRDDARGFGSQTIALFGEPDSGKFEFVMTGRHLTVRCDGDSAEHAAFGGPIFYGHAVKGEEDPNHPGNVFWSQALKANKLYTMLDGKQRKQSLVKSAPVEKDVHFRKGKSAPEGMPVAEMSADQKEQVQKVLKSLIEPYRGTDRKEALAALKTQGGLDKCRIAFYESDDIGEDGVWDTWRLEGPAFVWHWRGNPHVHVWVNVADDPKLQIATT